MTNANERRQIREAKAIEIIKAMRPSREEIEPEELFHVPSEPLR